MENVKSSTTRKALWLVIFTISLFGQGQTANSQWWKDTVWTKDTYVNGGFYMLKFSNNDSIIVGHNIYNKDYFYDAATGNEIGWIWGKNEVHYFNNDLNFLRLNQDEKTIEIWDAKTYQVVDSLESDDIKVGNIDISDNERYVVGVINKGIRSWDLQTKRILKTKLFPKEENLTSIGIGFIKVDCTNERFVGQFAKKYINPDNPDNPIYIGYFGVYDIHSLDSIDYYENGITFRVSNTCKFIAKKVNKDNGIEIYDFNTKELIWELPLNSSTITGYEFSPDDKYLVTSSDNNAIGMSIWNMETGEKHFHYISGATYDNIAVSHDGKYITYSISDGLRLVRTHFNDVSVNEPDNSIKILYPNPTSDYIIVGANGHSPLRKEGVSEEISIFDVFGNSVLTVETRHALSLQKIDISALPPGVYFVRIGNENPQKFMIVR